MFNSSYRPKLNPDEPNSGITCVASRSMQAYFHTGGVANEHMNGTGNYALRVLRGNVTSVPSPNNPNPFTGQDRFKVKPGLVTADTDVVTIEGAIFDWCGTPGCRVDFRASYRANPHNAVP